MNSYMDLNEDKEKMLYYHYTCATGMLIPAQLSPPWHNSQRHLQLLTLSSCRQSAAATIVHTHGKPLYPLIWLVHTGKTLNIIMLFSNFIDAHELLSLLDSQWCEVKSCWSRGCGVPISMFTKIFTLFSYPQQSTLTLLFSFYKICNIDQSPPPPPKYVN